MRLFIAINFDKDVVDALKSAQTRLREYTISGNYTKKENLHLTVVFIGEVSAYKVTVIKDILKELPAPAFNIRFNGFGCFKGRKGDTFWMGVENNSILTGIHDFLKKRLDEIGLHVENKEYKPHLTLIREVKLRDDASFTREIKFPQEFDGTGVIHNATGMNARVSRVSLMRSDFENGSVRYTEIYGKELYGGTEAMEA